MMSDVVTGHCMCGQFRYQIRTGPKFALLCQCRDCQHITGSGHSALFGAAAADTEWHGEIGRFAFTANSNSQMTSVFCPVCGNPLFKTSERYPELIFFHAATLEDPTRFLPRRAVWCASGQPWDKLDPALPQEPD